MKSRLLVACALFLGAAGCWQEKRAQVEACVAASASDAGVACLPAGRVAAELPVDDLCGISLVSVDDGPVVVTQGATTSCCYLVTEDFPTLGFCE